jgi:glycosyltransferase involved in cell wall biosynthesis
VTHSASRFDVVQVTRVTSAGVRRHVVDVLLGLHELGVRQALIYSPGGADQAFWDASKRLEALGIPAFAVEMKREIDLRADVRAGREILAILGRLRPKIVHLHSSKAGGIGRLALLGRPGPRVVYTPNASAASLGRKYIYAERLLGRMRTDRLVAVSASEREEIAGLGYVRSDRLARIDNGVELREVRAGALAEPEVPLPDGPLVVASGRLSPQKDPEFLVQVAKRLAPEFPDLRFVWIGEGELRPEVERGLAVAGLAERWTITGWLTNPFPILARASVFALPSRYEGLPYALLEAMTLGRPVVATNVTGTRDAVLNGVTGYLTPPGDVGAFAQAVARIVRDPAHAAALGAAAANRAEHFSRQRMTAELLQLYRELGLPAGA